MHAIDEFRDAVVEWAATGDGTTDAASAARRMTVEGRVRTMVLVEGGSDRVAVETLAVRRGRDLDAEGVCVVPMGGVTSITRFLDLVGPGGLDGQVAGLCDAREERYFRRALERAGCPGPLDRAAMERIGFFVCVDDLEDELIGTLGVDAVLGVVGVNGDTQAFRTLQNQPAQRGRPVSEQLHRFMGVRSGRKAEYARILVEALDLERVPRSLDELLGWVG